MTAGLRVSTTMTDGSGCRSSSRATMYGSPCVVDGNLPDGPPRESDSSWRPSHLGDSLRDRDRLRDPWIRGGDDHLSVKSSTRSCSVGLSLQTPRADPIMFSGRILVADDEPLVRE